MIMQEKDGLLKHIIFEQDELNLGVPETAPENPLPRHPIRSMKGRWRHGLPTTKGI